MEEFNRLPLIFPHTKNGNFMAWSMINMIYYTFQLSELEKSIILALHKIVICIYFKTVIHLEM